MWLFVFFFFSSRRRHTRSLCDWSSDVCSSDLEREPGRPHAERLSRFRRAAGTPTDRDQEGRGPHGGTARGAAADRSEERRGGRGEMAGGGGAWKRKKKRTCGEQTGTVGEGGMA